MMQRQEGNPAGLYQQNQYQGGLNQYDPNQQLTKALNRLAKAIEELKPRVRVKMGRSVV